MSRDIILNGNGCVSTCLRCNLTCPRKGDRIWKDHYDLLTFQPAN